MALANTSTSTNMNFFKKSVPVNSVLAIMIVRTWYTSIPNNEGITAAKKDMKLHSQNFTLWKCKDFLGWIWTNLHLSVDKRQIINFLTL